MHTLGRGIFCGLQCFIYLEKPSFFTSVHFVLKKERALRNNDFVFELSPQEYEERETSLINKSNVSEKNQSMKLFYKKRQLKLILFVCI